MAGGREGGRERRKQVLLVFRMLSVRLLALLDSFNSFQFCYQTDSQQICSSCKICV
jgi:hypothetical protein